VGAPYFPPKLLCVPLLGFDSPHISTFFELQIFLARCSSALARGASPLLFPRPLLPSSFRCFLPTRGWKRGIFSPGFPHSTLRNAQKPPLKFCLSARVLADRSRLGQVSCGGVLRVSHLSLEARCPLHFPHSLTPNPFLFFFFSVLFFI